MSLFKKLTAVLLTLCLLIPSFSAIAAGELQAAIAFGATTYTANADLEGSAIVDKNLKLNMGGYTLTGTEGQPVLTVAPGVELTITNGVIYALGDVTVPAIALMEGAKLTLQDTVVIGAVAMAKQLLSPAIAAAQGAEIVLNNSAVIGGYGIANAANTAVTVNDSIILGTAAAMTDATAATADDDYKMVDIGDYLQDRVDSATADKLLDRVVSGRAIVSIKRLSTAVKGEADGAVLNFTAEEMPSRYMGILDYVWVPYNVIVEGKEALFADDDFDGVYTAAITLDAAPEADVKADVDFKLNVTMSAYLQTALAAAPIALEKVLDKIDSYEYQKFLVNKLNEAVQPYLDLYDEKYAEVADMLADAAAQLNTETEAIDQADKVMADTLVQLADAQAQLDDAAIKLADADVKLLDAKAQYATAQAKLAEAEVKLNGLVAIGAPANEIDNARIDLLKAQNELADYAAKLADAEAQLADAHAQHSDAQALVSEATADVTTAQGILDSLEAEVDALKATVADIIADYHAIGAEVDAIKVIYAQLSSVDNITAWATGNYQAVVDGLNKIQALIDSIDDAIVDIKDTTIPAMQAEVDTLITLGNKFGYSFSYDAAGLTGSLDTAYNTLGNLKSSLDNAIAKINKLVNSNEFEIALDLLTTIDPETLIKTAWAKLVAEGPEVLENLIWDAEYFAAKYNALMNKVANLINTAIDKYPTAKDAVLSLADTYITEANADRFIAFAEAHFPTAIAKYPELADTLFSKLKVAVAKYPAAADKLEAIADKMVAVFEFRAPAVRDLIDTFVLGYVNPFLHGEYIETLTGDTVVIIDVDATETEAPETNAPETNAPETNAPETNAPETNAPETNAPETNAPETNAPETNAPETNAPETNDPTPDDPDNPGTGDSTLKIAAFSSIAAIALGALYLVDKKRII